MIKYNLFDLMKNLVEYISQNYELNITETIDSEDRDYVTRDKTISMKKKEG